MTDQQIEGARHEGVVPDYSPTERACQLTTFGRADGRAYDVAMRYAMHDDTMYMLSDEGGEADWVQNLIKNPEVSVRLDEQTFSGMGRVVTSPNEESMARRLLAAEYEDWHEDQPLTPWASNGLPVAIDRTPHVH